VLLLHGPSSFSCQRAFGSLHSVGLNPDVSYTTHLSLRHSDNTSRSVSFQPTSFSTCRFSFRRYCYRNHVSKRKLRRIEVAEVCNTGLPAKTLKYYLLHVTGRHYTCVDIMFVESHKCKSKDHGMYIQHALMRIRYHTFSVRSASFSNLSVIRSDDATEKNDNSKKCAPQYRRAPQRVGHTFSLDCSPTSPAKMVEIM
jgi:hypothetical protein